MSNKRRKSRGSAKLERNRLARTIRGAIKSDSPLPGYGRLYRPPEGWVLSSALDRRGVELRASVDDLHGVAFDYRPLSGARLSSARSRLRLEDDAE